MAKEWWNVSRCERCGVSLEGKAHILSWFTTQEICMSCAEAERIIRAALPNGGADHEGCGYLPETSP